jgi:hypothetical protein
MGILVWCGTIGRGEGEKTLLVSNFGGEVSDISLSIICVGRRGWSESVLLVRQRRREKEVPAVILG